MQAEPELDSGQLKLQYIEKCVSVVRPLTAKN